MRAEMPKYRKKSIDKEKLSFQKSNLGLLGFRGTYQSPLVENSQSSSIKIVKINKNTKPRYKSPDLRETEYADRYKYSVSFSHTYSKTSL